MIKPFVMKCHPDMAKQQGLSTRAQDINLRAIQNLNAFVDGVVAMEEGSAKYPFDSMLRGRKEGDDSPILVQIDFVMSFTDDKTAFSQKKKAVPTTSQRSVELQVPPPGTPSHRVKPHAQRQFSKLLQMAGLQVPNLAFDVNDGDDFDIGQPSMDGDPRFSSTQNKKVDDYVSHMMERELAKQYGGSDERYRDFVRDAPHRRNQTHFERSRQAFMDNVDWDKFRALKRRQEEDYLADMMTKGMIRNDPVLRRDSLSKILRNVRVDTRYVTPLEQLVVLRRIFRVLDTNFDRLDLEKSGHYWEEVLTIIVTQARTYNTSPTALYKRRMKKLTNGFSFKIHHDDRVTVRVPVDFTDSEFVEELSRNLESFYEWIKRNSGTYDIFKS